MKRLTSKISVGKYTLAGVVDFSSESSWEMLTDTAEITLPSQVKQGFKFVNLAESQLIRRGDKVSVDLGYDSQNLRVFEGFVSDVLAGSPVRIQLQDYAWLLKKAPKTVSYKSVTLKKLLSDICPPEIKINAVDVNLGQFRVTNATPAMVLDEIKKTYHLQSWFRGNILNAGSAYLFGANPPTYTFKFQENIISDSLIYRNKDEIKIKVKGVSMMPNNTKIESEQGDPDGELRTYHYYNLQKADLDKAILADIEKLRFDGYSGSFETFGFPRVQHGDFVKLIDTRYNRKGVYLVKKVRTSFGANGFRQTIELDRKA
jgi:hypothetical protein